MKNTILVLAAIFVLITTPALAQSWQWAKQNSTGLGTGGMEWGGGFPDPLITTDNWGNIYMFGSYGGTTLSFGACSVTNPSTGVWTFIAKFDSTGNAVWLHNVGGVLSNTIVVSGIATDATGKVYIAGTSSDTIISFGSIMLHKINAGTEFGLFLAKYDSSGNAVWARAAGGGLTNGCSLTIDGNNNVYIGGNVYDSIKIGSISAVCLNRESGLVAKFDTAGTALSIKLLDGATTFFGTLVMSLTTDANQDLFVTGFTNTDTMHIGTFILPINGASSLNHLFVIKYDSSSNFLWARSIGGDSNDYKDFISTIVDTSGSIYINSSSNSSVITTGTIMNNNNLGTFMLKYDQDGNYIWFKSTSLYNPVLCNDKHDNIYISSIMCSYLVLGSDTANYPAGCGIAVIKIDTSATPLWVKVPIAMVTKSTHPVQFL